MVNMIREKNEKSETKEEKVSKKPIFEDATVRKISTIGDCACGGNQCP